MTTEPKPRVRYLYEPYRFHLRMGFEAEVESRLIRGAPTHPDYNGSGRGGYGKDCRA